MSGELFFVKYLYGIMQLIPFSICISGSSINFRSLNLVPFSIFHVVIAAVSVLICFFPRFLVSYFSFFVSFVWVLFCGGSFPSMPPKMKFSYFLLSSGSNVFFASGSRMHGFLRFSSFMLLLSQFANGSFDLSFMFVKRTFSFPRTSTMCLYSSLLHSYISVSRCSIIIMAF